AHEEPHLRARGEGTEETFPDEVEPRGLHERRKQIDLARPRAAPDKQADVMAGSLRPRGTTMARRL
ncbi:MAG: hypothetical protein ACKO1M_13350, partial [Planctomycetota bacterium]